MFIITTLRNLKQMSIRILFATVFIFSINTMAAEKKMPNVFEDGDASKGANMVAACAACHGADGNSMVPSFPKIAGQYEDYLYQALKSYKDGTRNNAIMSGIASTLNEKQMRKLSKYFASHNGLDKINQGRVALKK